MRLPLMLGILGLYLTIRIGKETVVIDWSFFQRWIPRRSACLQPPSPVVKVRQQAAVPRAGAVGAIRRRERAERRRAGPVGRGVREDARLVQRR